MGMQKNILEIDGSIGEGGGQIIRTSLSMSALYGVPIKIKNIRKGRKNPGLRMQHVTAAKAVRRICRGKLIKAEVGSTELEFYPGEIIGGRYTFNIGTAGSTILVAQAILPILLKSKKRSEIEIIGGTHVYKSPNWDYFNNVFLKALGAMGLSVKSELKKVGFYPVGNGQINISIEKNQIEKLEDGEDITLDNLNDLEYKANNGKSGKYDEISSIIRVANLPETIAIREKKVLINNGITNIKVRKSESESPGNSITCWRGFKGMGILGEKGKRAENVAKECLEELKEMRIGLDIGIDKFLADQLLIYGVLRKGKLKFSTKEITNHFETNFSILKMFYENKKKGKIEKRGNSYFVSI